jgi:hypothetical protein
MFERVLIPSIALAAACSSPTAERPVATDTTATVTAGKAVNATLVGDPLVGVVATSLNVVVRVADSANVAVRGQLVNFVVAGGGGTVFAGSAITDTAGKAREVWTLGPSAGEQAIEARTVDPSTGTAVVLGRVPAVASPGPFAGASAGKSAYTLFTGMEFRLDTLVKRFSLRASDSYGNALDIAVADLQWRGAPAISATMIGAPSVGTYYLTFKSAPIRRDSVRISVLDKLDARTWRAVYSCWQTSQTPSDTSSYDFRSDSVRYGVKVPEYASNSTVWIYWTGTVSTFSRTTGLRTTRDTTAATFHVHKVDLLEVSSGQLDALRQADGSYVGGSMCPSNRPGRSVLTIAPLAILPLPSPANHRQ